MAVLIVVNDPRDWPLAVPGVEVVEARSYLTDRRYLELRQARVFNLCRSYRYQRLGYYVSLLGAARGHRPIPSVRTLQDLRLPGVVRTAGWDLDKLMEKSLRGITVRKFTLSIYFGRNIAKKYDPLARAIHALFPAPLLRAQLVKLDQWALQSVAPISANEIPDSHRELVLEAARSYFEGRPGTARSRKAAKYDLALLVRPDDPEPPSDERGLARFEAACRRAGIAVERIGVQDYGRLPEFDALFIRETTAVNHYSFRFARRAEAEGLIVIDDPDSIIRCGNKVFLTELIARNGVPAPRSIVVHAANLPEVVESLGFPCVLKTPDGSFSTGVTKVETMEELRETAERILAETDLFLAQEFVPTAFDWRIGVLDGEALYACRYHMAKKHWQIVDPSRSGPRRYGDVEALPLEQVPETVLRSATRAAKLIGQGLYGVDVKETMGRGLVIEVNDNPNLEAGCEDRVLGSALWDRIARTFLARIEARGGAQS